VNAMLRRVWAPAALALPSGIQAGTAEDPPMPSGMRPVGPLALGSERRDD